MISPDLAIRPLCPADRSAWEPLWQGYLTFYKSSVPSAQTERTWQRFHDAAVPMHALGAFSDDRLIGIVHYLYHYSCWSDGPYCYLQDLYTVAESRGHGAGRALIERVYSEAQGAGASRVYWLTHETNAEAMVLYNKVADRSGFLQYRHML